MLQTQLEVSVRTRIALRAAIFFGSLALVAGLFVEAGRSPLGVPAARTSLEALTRQIERQLPPAKRQRQLSTTERNRLRALIAVRKREQRRLISTDPNRVIRNALPPGLRERLPEELRGELERSVTVEGELAILHRDNLQQGTWEDAYTLTTAENLEYAIAFTNRQPLEAQSTVRVTGVQVDTVIAVPGETTENVTVLSDPAPAVSLETKKVAVFLFNFQTNPTSQPFTVPQVKASIFTDPLSTRSYYGEMSRNALDFVGSVDPTGDVFGWFTIPYSNATCTTANLSTWRAAVNAAAAASGVTLNYDYYFYVFPSTGACSWAGASLIGGNWLMANGGIALELVGHELGHAFGAHHAGNWWCQEGSTRVPLSQDQNCSWTLWNDDPFDIMRSYLTGTVPNQMSAFHKAKIGLYGAGETQDVTTAGTYSLLFQESADTGVKSIRIPRKYYAPGLASEYLYLEYRRPFGVFDNFGAGEPVVNGVSIRVAKGLSTNWPSSLVDSTPATATYTDAALAPGQPSVVDPVGGIIVTTESVSPTTAMVNIAFTCVRQRPWPVLSGNWWIGRPGTTISNPLAIQNLDLPACEPSTFAVTAQLPESPAGWTQTVYPDPVIIPANSQGTVTASLSIPASVADGFNAVTEVVTNASLPQYTQTRLWQVLVDGTSPDPPTNLRSLVPMTAADGAVPQRSGAVQVAGVEIAVEQIDGGEGGGGSSDKFIALAWDAPADGEIGSGIAGYKLYFCWGTDCMPAAVRDLGAVTAYAFPATTLGATYSFEVTAIDRAGNESGRSNRVNVFVPQ